MFKQNKNNKNQYLRLFGSIIFIIILIAFVFYNIKNKISYQNVQIEELSYSSAISMIQKGDISEITFYINNSEEVRLKAKTGKEYEVTLFNQGVFYEFIQEKIENGQEIKINKIDNDYSIFNFISDISCVLAIVLIILLIAYVNNFFKTKKEDKNDTKQCESYNNQQNTLPRVEITQVKETKTEQSKSNVKFCDVAGLDEEKFELEEVVDFLKNPEKYQEMGAKIPKGILLSGAPGTGKTLLAKALAGEAGVAFIHASGAEFVEKYVGVGAQRIRTLFDQARREAPCIIFIDEIDAIGSERIEDSNSVEHNQTLEQLLIEMDGFETKNTEGIVVVAATNRANSLDRALLRPGRFDRHILVHLPDIKGREEILIIHSRNKKIDDSVDFKKIAHNTSGFSGAQLANLLNEASIMAVRNMHEKISKSDINSALKKIVVGLQKSGQILSEKERKLIAYHESGHAVVSLFMKTQKSVKEISIIGAGDAGGYTWYETAEDKNFISKTELLAEVVSLLGGRAAEKIFIKDISTGASNDLKRATDIVTKMLVSYGMDDVIGPISMEGEYREYLDSGEYSFLLGKRTKELLCESEKQATRILQKHSIFVDELAKLLLEKETVHGEELYQMFRAYQNTYAETNNV